MTDTKWTPGPWRWFDGGPVAPYGVYEASENGGRQLAYVGSFRGGADQLANSQLMAAAPDLYEALLIARGVMMSAQQSVKVAGITFAVELANAALAKARGDA